MPENEEYKVGTELAVIIGQPCRSKEEGQRGRSAHGLGAEGLGRQSWKESGLINSIGTEGRRG